MTTYRIHCRSRVLDATDRDRWPQPGGDSVPTAELNEAHVIVGAGRVLKVARVVVEERSA